MDVCECLLVGLNIFGCLCWCLYGDVWMFDFGLCQFDLVDDLQGLCIFILECLILLMFVLVEVEFVWLGCIIILCLCQLVEMVWLYEVILCLVFVECLQWVLYVIVEQVGVDYNMFDMMCVLYGIVGSLMYVENFYIVFYDEVFDSVCFFYYVDMMDLELFLFDESVLLKEIEYSLIWNLFKVG